MTQEQKLTAAAVNEILKRCMFVRGEDTHNHIIGEGVINKFGFHPQRLKESEEDVLFLLRQLPKDFQDKRYGDGMGDGQSFLNAYIDKDGNQWGEHLDIEKLIVLGKALGLVDYCFPREMWPELPGGLPYFVVKYIEPTQH